MPLLAIGNVNVSGSLLTSLSLPSLTTSNVTVSGTSLTSLSLPLLTTGSFTLSGVSITSLSLPSFTTGSLNISDTSLISLDLPLFNTSSRDSYSFYTLYVLNNKKLTSINIPKLISVSGDVYMYSNSFSSTEINKLLSLFNNKVTFKGLKNIYLNSQTIKAPPSGQGIIDKNALIAKGYAVLTD